MIEINNVNFSFGSSEVFRNLNVSFDNGRFYGIIGTNGCGKTTLLKLISKQLFPSTGKIFVDGINIADISRMDFAKKVSQLPQERHKVSISVYDLISTGRYPYHGSFGRYDKDDASIILDSAEKAGVLQFIDKDVRFLSGGEAQKVYIAAVLAQRTPYILLDEPTTFLDVSAKFEVISLLKRICLEGRGVVAVLHDISLAMKYCDELFIINKESMSGILTTPVSAFERGIIQDVFNVKCSASYINGKTEFFISER